MRCATCKERKEPKFWEGPVRVFDVEVVGRGEQCPDCDDVQFDYAELGRQEDMVEELIREHGIRSGLQFKFARRRLKMTGTELGKHLGVTTETVSRWETGKTDIPMAMRYIMHDMLRHPRKTKKRIAGYAAAPNAQLNAAEATTKYGAS